MCPWFGIDGLDVQRWNYWELIPFTFLSGSMYGIAFLERLESHYIYLL